MSVICCDTRPLPGVGDLIDIIFPRNQAWYDRIARDQAEITALLAEVNAVGRSTWDEILARTAGAIRDGYKLPMEHFTGFDWTTEDLIAQNRAIMLTHSKLPTDAEINTAESRITMYRAMVEYVKSIIPELASAVQAEGDEYRAKVLAMPLRSPAEVGMETFRNELAARAKALGNVGMGLGTIALFIFAAIAASRMFGGGR